MNSKRLTYKQYASFIIGFFVLLFMLNSCTMQQRRYLRGVHFESKFTKSASKAQSSSDQSALTDLALLHASINHPQIDLEETTFTVSLESLPQAIAVENPQVKHVGIQAQFKSRPDSLQPCQKMIMNNGNEISAVILEIGTTEIRYKRCENRSGPDYVLPKSLVFLIQYPDGTNEIISPKTESNFSSNDRRVQPLGVIGSVLGLLGIIAFGIPLGIIAMTFGNLSMDRIKRNPEKLKGKGWAIASVILGALSAIGALFVIYFVL